MTAVLLCRSGDDAGLVQRITGGRCLIGRAADADLSILHGQLSRHHALVSERQGEGYVVEDLGSRNGTSVNGQRVEGGTAVRVRHADVVTFGLALDFVFLELEQVPSTEIVAAALVGPDGARAPLQLGANTIGSSHDGDLIVEDPSVSERHARLILTSASLTVERESDGGEVRVDGEPVEVATLEHGDVLWLAPTAEFVIEVVRGLAELPPRAEAAPEGAEADEATTIETEPVAEDAIPSVTDAALATAAGAGWVKALEGVLPRRPETGSTASLEPSEVTSSLNRARERAKRVSGEDADATDAAGSPSRAAAEPSSRSEGSSGIRRGSAAWAGGASQQRELRAIRREAAARIHVQHPVPGGVEEQVVLLREGRHVVGRSDAARVRITDLSVSREHAEIHVGPQGIVVRDLGSSNGTWHEGRRVDKLDVKPDMRVRFGDVLCWFDEL